MSAPWRLLIDGPADGAWNMAVDEALLESQSSSPSMVPTFRLYSWQPSTLSLGSRQPRLPDDRWLMRPEGIALTRRPTGGSAVLHGRDRTYAIAGRLGREAFPGGVVDTYRRVAMALTAAFKLLGLDVGTLESSRVGERDRRSSPACFDRTSVYEIVLRGRKIVGSAQLRRRGAFLQHGSIPIDSEEGWPGREAGTTSKERFMDLKTALGRVPEVREIDEALVKGFEAAFDVKLSAGSLTDREEIRATRLRSWKYASAAWTLRGNHEEPERGRYLRTP